MKKKEGDEKNDEYNIFQAPEEESDEERFDICEE